jgi:hypothetical protein
MLTTDAMVAERVEEGQGALSRITEFLRYVRVDFDDCDAGEVLETYRAFAMLCLHKHVNGALLKAGDDDPNGHYGVRDAVAAMARHAPLPYDFKLALVPSTRPVEAVYRDAQEGLRAAGLNAWVFPNENDATNWLEGRVTGGRMVS